MPAATQLEGAMTETSNTLALREADECLYLFECQIGRAAALAALSSANGRQDAAARARRALSEGGQYLAALREHRRRMGGHRKGREDNIMAG